MLRASGALSMIDAADIEAIERATLAALAPRVLEERDGWLLPFEPGTIGRAKSAVPLSHDRPEAGIVPVIEQRFAAHALPPRFRIAGDERLEPLRTALRDRGYRAEQPTLVEIAPAAAARARTGEAPAQRIPSPDAAWTAVYTGEGFDPIDGACRVRAFARAHDAMFACVREAHETVAVGVAAFGYGWASVHGMRTARTHRRRGLARRVLAALAEAALERGIGRIFLQVEEANTAARALYAGAGFRTAWRYWYWLRQS